MKTRLFTLTCLSLSLMIAMLTAGCGGSDSSDPTTPTLPYTLVEQSVNVAGGGGSANVSFSGNSGQQIRITLKAANTAMVPYGYLNYPDGAGTYHPANGSAQNGESSAELLLAKSGSYTLTVFDGTNQGGAVTVKVEVLAE